MEGKTMIWKWAMSQVGWTLDRVDAGRAKAMGRRVRMMGRNILRARRPRLRERKSWVGTLRWCFGVSAGRLIEAQ